MKFCKYLMIGSLVVNGYLTSMGWSEVLNENYSTEESSAIFLEPNHRLGDVLEYADSYFYSTDSIQPAQANYDLRVSTMGVTLSPKKTWRDYNIPVSKKEKQDVAYIINSLSKDSLVSLAKSRSSIKKVGDRVEHLHPLRFLMTIFTSEELKAGIHGIRDRSWVWDEFCSGLIDNLKEEFSHQNLKDEYVLDFAERVKIDPNLITPSIHQGQWKQFINILIDRIPRQNDSNRYNI